MTGLCKCGCGGVPSITTKTRGSLKKGEHYSYCHGHHTKIRVFQRWEIDPLSGCWNWIAAINKGGYGTIRINGNTYLAHIVFYESIKGPVPEGLELDHLCRNRKCVNPDHLEPVTSKENTRRGNTAKLTMAQADEIRSKYASGFYKQRELAQEYCVSGPTISAVVTGRVWS